MQDFEQGIAAALESAGFERADVGDVDGPDLVVSGTPIWIDDERDGD